METIAYSFLYKTVSTPHTEIKKFNSFYYECYLEIYINGMTNYWATLQKILTKENKTVPWIFKSNNNNTKLGNNVGANTTSWGTINYNVAVTL